MALLDSGAIASFLGPKPAELVKSRITPCSTYMVMANGQTDKIGGEVELTFTIDGEEITTRIRVLNSLNYDIILGMDLMERLRMRINFEDRTWYTPKGIVHPCYPKNQDPSTVYTVAALDGVAELSQGERILLRVKLDPFLDTARGGTPAARITPHKIDVQGHSPIKQKMRRISPNLLTVVHAEVDRLLAEGIVEPSKSPWSSCPVIVPKKDGSIRFCIDYRQLNQITKKDAYPLPHMDSLLDNIGNAKYLSKIELRQAYHQILLEESSKEVTAFAIPGKGLSQRGSPASFQRAMDNIFGPEWQPQILYTYIMYTWMILLSPLTPLKNTLIY